MSSCPGKGLVLSKETPIHFYASEAVVGTEDKRRNNTTEKCSHGSYHSESSKGFVSCEPRVGTRTQWVFPIINHSLTAPKPCVASLAIHGARELSKTAPNDS